ncbi:DUF4150 domain-containing protein [Rhizobium halophytocola]|uniref:DUF4150 domain-containing protein n=1 Tax=Rhizobium halophytocola TaxID=735519 RepID=A0ABS4E656_9HYPH|nr:DUF4150 domain-containing protein [Rhizobium halophytocola]MBP1853426.1 hypothetical protein [Rhizobium halophytocola]
MSLPPPREGSRATPEGIIISKYPDVCRSPVAPVPYTIIAYQNDDANTASSVFLTGQRAHKQNSLVTRSMGDEPGTGLGVKSGTVSSICQRKTHSQTVRIEGEWATRHDDEWWMNNKNTVGKLSWPKHHLTFEPTPPLKEKPTEASTSSSQRLVMSDATPFAFQSGQQYAYLDQNGRFTGPGSSPTTKPPAPLPPPDVKPPQVKPPTEPKPPATEPGSGWRRWWKIGLMTEIALIEEAFHRLAGMPKRLEEAHHQDLVNQGRTPEAIASNVNSNFKNTDLGRWYPGTITDYANEIAADPSAEERLQLQYMVDQATKEKQTELDTLTPPPEPAGRTPNNVSTKDRRRRRRNCRLRPYKKGCADAAPYSTPHHVVADRAFRAPGKNGALYKGGVPHADGYCICVDGGTPVFKGPKLNEHGVIHSIYNDGEKKLGAAGEPPGTAKLENLEKVGVVSAAVVTGCDPADLLRQLRNYHRNERKLSGSTLFRADPSGTTSVDPSAVGSGSGNNPNVDPF